MSLPRCIALFLLLGAIEAARGAVISDPIVDPANGHTYCLLAEAAWTASEAEATSLGGHLATINDAAEDTWVFQTFGTFDSVDRDLWIGLTSPAGDWTDPSTYGWADGSPSIYRNWRSGQPDLGVGQEDRYVVINYAGFGDVWDNYPDSGFGGLANGVMEMVPEPGALLVFGIGAVAVFLRRRNRSLTDFSTASVSSFPAACLALLLMTCGSASAGLINGGFESSDPVGIGLPTTFGGWGGDGATIVTTENSIVPVEGTHMLRFDHTSFMGDSGARGGVWQLVDATGITPGTVMVASSAFNRVAGNAQTDTQFIVEIDAYSGSPSGFPDTGLLASTSTNLFSDSNPSTWEPATASLSVPTGTSYLAVLVAAYQNVAMTSPPFDGHYADAAVLGVPEPGACALAWIGLAIATTRCRRRGRG